MILEVKGIVTWYYTERRARWTNGIGGYFNSHAFYLRLPPCCHHVQCRSVSTVQLAPGWKLVNGDNKLKQTRTCCGFEERQSTIALLARKSFWYCIGRIMNSTQCLDTFVVDLTPYSERNLCWRSTCNIQSQYCDIENATLCVLW